MDGAFLDWALASFSGYVAADKLYEGPYCVLSVVDNRQYKRILYAVLDHDPTHPDITTFLGRLKTALTERDLVLQGITTDGSPLYPEPIRTVFGAVAQESLLIYFVHLCIVYGSVWNRGLTQTYGPTLTPVQTLAAVLVVIASMVGLAWYWNRLKHVHPRIARGMSYAAGAVMLYRLL